MRLLAARLDNSHAAELRKLLRVDPLILDDFALGELNQADTDDLYEIVVERHRNTSTTISTSNREPVKAHRFERTCARRMNPEAAVAGPPTARGAGVGQRKP